MRVPEWFKWLLGHSAQVVSLVTILGLLSMAAENYVGPPLQRFLGITVIKEEIVQIKDRLARIEPKSQISVYDPHFSRVEGPCIIGDECHLQIRVRRTEFGAACELLGTAAEVMNSKGRIHSAEIITGESSVPFFDEWRFYVVTFVVPRSVQPGQAYIQLAARFSCPDGNLTQLTPQIPFEAISHDTFGER